MKSERTEAVTTDRRDDKARFLLASAGQWLKVRTKDGRPLAYGIPSATRPGLVHLAKASRCTCEDSQWGHHCYHSRAVALHVARVRAEQAREGVVAAA
jgi:hypothetical protein